VEGGHAGVGEEAGGGVVDVVAAEGVGHGGGDGGGLEQLALAPGGVAGDDGVAAAGVVGVVHLAFDHSDLTRYEAAATDRLAIGALGEPLRGTGRPLVIASGLMGLASGRPTTEDDRPARGAARLFRLALEEAPAGSVVHGVGEEGVPTRAIAEAVGRQLDLPVTAVAPEAAGTHFGWLARFLADDVPASRALTRARLGWDPKGPDLLDDLARWSA
jgi:hypothetical protein